MSKFYESIVWPSRRQSPFVDPLDNYGFESIMAEKRFFSSTGCRPASLCHGPLSIERVCIRPFVCPSIGALLFFLNSFSETTYQILMKFHGNVPAIVLLRFPERI